MNTKEELKMLQALPLEVKIAKTKQRIKEWVEYYGLDDIYISISGGKDSQVLLHIARQIYPDIKAVFINTGLEWNSVRQKGIELADTVLVPEMNFVEVIKKYGYPVISKEVAQCIWEARKGLKNGKYQYRLAKLNGTYKNKNGELSTYQMTKYKPLLYAPFRISHMCCNVMKKRPSKKYKKNPIIGTMACESSLRASNWVRNGCNAFNAQTPKSAPMSFWMEDDVIKYIEENKLEIAKIYNAVSRTGCVFCLFGISYEKDKFITLKNNDRKKYDFVMNGGEFDEEGMWIPTQEGLGYRFILNWLNENMNLDIKY